MLTITWKIPLHCFPRKRSKTIAKNGSQVFFQKVSNEKSPPSNELQEYFPSRLNVDSLCSWSTKLPRIQRNTVEFQLLKNFCHRKSSLSRPTANSLQRLSAHTLTLLPLTLATLVACFSLLFSSFPSLLLHSGVVEHVGLGFSAPGSYWLWLLLALALKLWL